MSKKKRRNYSKEYTERGRRHSGEHTGHVTSEPAGWSSLVDSQVVYIGPSVAVGGGLLTKVGWRSEEEKKKQALPGKKEGKPDRAWGRLKRTLWNLESIV